MERRDKSMITLLQLDYFRKLAATEHITKTAKELYISQTALSSMIIGLEKELGTPLFDRSNRAIHLNEAGKTYLKYVNEVFRSLENGKSALADLGDAHEKDICLAMGTSQVWVPMLRSFHSAFPQYRIKQSGMSRTGLYNSLRDLQVDFVLAGMDDIALDGFAYEEIKDDGIYLCVSENHRFANRDSVYLEEIHDEKFINLSDESPWGEYCNRLFEQAGYKINPSIICDYTLRSALIETGMGVALTTGLARDIDLLKPNKYIRIADKNATRKMAIIWNPQKYMSKASECFKDFCITYIKENQKPA